MTLEERQKMLNDFKKSLDGKTEEELKKIEQDIVKEAEENDEKLGKLKFKLPKENYKIVATEIRNILNLQKVKWQIAFTYVGLYDFWDPEKFPKTISYFELDTILNVLGGIEFEGYSQWSAVVAINKYFTPIRDEYVNAVDSIYEIAGRHDVVIEKLKLFAPIGNVSPDTVQ